jgi:hypothetical protein
MTMGSDEPGAWRSGFVEPAWHQNPIVRRCRIESIRAYKALRELMMDGVPEQLTAEQSAARERALHADAAYEAAKWSAITAHDRLYVMTGLR